MAVDLAYGLGEETEFSNGIIQLRAEVNLGGTHFTAKNLLQVCFFSIFNGIQKSHTFSITYSTMSEGNLLPPSIDSVPPPPDEPFPSPPSSQPSKAGSPNLWS